MAQQLTAPFGDQRQAKRIGAPQRIDDKLLGVAAVLGMLKSRRSQGADGVDVVRELVTKIDVHKIIQIKDEAGRRCITGRQ
jgi:hypothetical protein